MSVEIRPTEAGQLQRVVEALRQIGVPGLTTDQTITVVGYVEPGHAIDWL